MRIFRRIWWWITNRKTPNVTLPNNVTIRGVTFTFVAEEPPNIGDVKL